MRTYLRAAKQAILVWLFCALYIPLMIVLLLVTLGRAKDTLGCALVRGWGYASSWLLGVKIAYTPAARAMMERREARVLTFNHNSTLDLMVGATMMCQGSVVIAKKELLYLPLIGQVILLLDVVRLARTNRQGATDTLKAVAKRIVDGRHSVLIAPEGTRSPNGKLGPFKLGPFHVAIAAQVPIYPIVIRGCADLMPRQARACLPGTVTFDVLPAIATAGLTAEDVRPLAERVRAAYLQALGEAPVAELTQN